MQGVSYSQAFTCNAVEIARVRLTVSNVILSKNSIAMEKDGRHEMCGAVKDPACVKGAALETA